MNNQLIAGVDEAGRGPLAGNVVAAAVILDPNKIIPGINDSKKLTPKKREQLYNEIIHHCLAYGIAEASVEEIDTINILQASLLAMQRAVEKLTVKPNLILVDGNRCPKWTYRSQAIIGGDQTELAIGAASILAKVTRDRQMIIAEELFPGYGFAQHKGYGTRIHLAAIEKLGPCQIHRRSFAPIKNA